MKGQVFLRKNIQRRIAYFHPWVYANEIGHQEGELFPGAVVDVFSHLGSFIGRGFYNPHASVTVKMIDFNTKGNFDFDFLQTKIQYAYQYRKNLNYQSNFRLFNAEGDGIPGLIIDHYKNVLVIQTLSLGINYYKDLLLEVLQSLFPEYLIYEQNAVFIRNLEGLNLYRKAHFDVELLKGLTFSTKGLQFVLDLEHHERTGFDWEIEMLWSAIAPLVKDKNVLHLFSGNGELAVLSQHGEAARVRAVDYNPLFQENAGRNEQLNEVKGLEKITENVFDYLKTKEHKTSQWDLVVINPSSMVHKAEQLKNAFTGYKELLIRSIAKINAGGFILVSFPHYLFAEKWIYELMHEVMRDLKVNLRLIKQINNRYDHPLPASLPQMNHFSAYLWQVIK